MKENLKKIGIIVISIIIMLSFCTSVKAIDDNDFTTLLSAPTSENLANLSMSIESTSGEKINVGETFVLDIRASEITLGNGIAAIQGTFDFDENVLEVVEPDDGNAVVNGWNKTYNSANKKFLLDRASNTNQDQVVAKFTLNVKERCTETSTTINLTNLTANDENEATSIGNKIINISINLSEENQNTDNQNNTNDENTINGGSNTNNDNNENTANDISDNDNQNTEEEENKISFEVDDETTKTSVAGKNTTSKSSKKIPNLGWEQAPIIIAIIAFVIIGIILYLKYYQYNV